MRAVTYSAATALIVLASLAAAQEPSVGEAQKQSFPAQPQAPAQQTQSPSHTIPPPPLAQPQAPLADQSKPAAVGPAQANTAGSLDNPTPPGATPQTMPSTISADNAALDKLPITALQFPLTEDQKKAIAKSVASAPKTPASADLSGVHVAGFLPTGVPMQDFSGDVTHENPPVARYKYVNLDDRILIVDPSILTVVGEIKR
jgi:hypothetical protein